MKKLNKLLLPREVRNSSKQRKRHRLDVRTEFIAQRIALASRVGGPVGRALGWPPIDGAAEPSGEGLKLVRYKRGVYCMTISDRYVRAARRTSGRRLLERELAAWERARALGISALGSPWLRRVDCSDGWTVVSDRVMELLPREAIWKALPGVVCPMVDCASERRVAPPMEVEFGRALMAEASKGIEVRGLPSIEVLQKCFAAPQRVGFFHCDLGPHNVMVCDGRYTLIDLKSCESDRFIDLELIRLLVRIYPEHHSNSLAVKAFKAQADDWHRPEAAQLASLIRLPREWWAGIYLYFAIGMAGRIEKHSPSSLRQKLQTMRSMPRLTHLAAQLATIGHGHRTPGHREAVELRLAQSDLTGPGG